MIERGPCLSGVRLGALLPEPQAPAAVSAAVGAGPSGRSGSTRTCEQTGCASGRHPATSRGRPICRRDARGATRSLRRRPPGKGLPAEEGAGRAPGVRARDRALTKERTKTGATHPRRRRAPARGALRTRTRGRWEAEGRQGERVADGAARRAPAHDGASIDSSAKPRCARTAPHVAGTGTDDRNHDSSPPTVKHGPERRLGAAG